MKRIPIVYFCHNYGGHQQNADEMIPIIQDLASKYDFIPISPIHNMGSLYNTVDYDKSIEHCIRLLNFAYCLVVFGNKSTSKGCEIEKKYSKENNIPIVEYDKFGEWYKFYMGDDYVDLQKKE